MLLVFTKKGTYISCSEKVTNCSNAGIDWIRWWKFKFSSYVCCINLWALNCLSDSFEACTADWSLDKCSGKLDDLHKKIVEAQVTQMLHYRCHDMSRGEDPLLVLKLLDGNEKFLWQWPSFMRSTALLVTSAFLPNLNNLCICNICNSGMLKCTKLYVCKILWGLLYGSQYIYIHSTSMFYHVLKIRVLVKCQEALASLCMSYLYKCGLLHFDLAWSYVVDFWLD